MEPHWKIEFRSYILGKDWDFNMTVVDKYLLVRKWQIKLRTSTLSNVHNFYGTMLHDH